MQDNLQIPGEKNNSNSERSNFDSKINNVDSKTNKFNSKMITSKTSKRQWHTNDNEEEEDKSVQENTNTKKLF